MTKSFKKSIYDNLERYDIFAKKDDFIEVTQWTNGEGYDVHIGRHGQTDTYISLSYGELDAINHLIRELDVSKKEDFNETT